MQDQQLTPASTASPKHQQAARTSSTSKQHRQEPAPPASSIIKKEQTLKAAPPVCSFASTEQHDPCCHHRCSCHYYHCGNRITAINNIVSVVFHLFFIISISLLYLVAAAVLQALVHVLFLVHLFSGRAISHT